MNGKYFSLIGIILYLIMCNVSQAAQPLVQGGIAFRGGLADPNCISRVNKTSGFELTNCPLPSGTNTLRAKRIEPIGSVSAFDRSHVHIKLIAYNSQGGRSYSQRYQLVDDSGSPIKSGMYLITSVVP